MHDEVFVSHAANHEDVVLWRALGSVRTGCYVDVGAGDPVEDSVTKAFYDRGWRGLSVAPPGDVTEQLRAARPDDVTLPSERLGDVLDRGDLGGKEIHFLRVAGGKAVDGVLGGLDLATRRPWVLVIAGNGSDPVDPDRWKPRLLAAGYAFCLFDGVTRFYVADERSKELAAPLSYPACDRDRFVTHAEAEARQLRDALWDDLVRWRGLALHGWAGAAAGGAVERPELPDESAQLREDVLRVQAEVERLQAELARMRQTVSWRVTRPLREARRFGRRTGAS